MIPYEKRFDRVLGEWARFSRYEVVDGVVRPAEGASLDSYDPWESFEKPQGRRKRVETPYGELLDLAAYLTQHPVRPPRSIAAEPVRGPQSEGEERILQWCNQFGLLGIGLATATSITLWPRWVEVKPGSNRLAVLQTTYTRVGAHWVRRERRSDKPRLQRGESGKPLSESALNSVKSSMVRSSVIMSDQAFDVADIPTLKSVPLADAWSGFFPSVPGNDAETYTYPKPLSPDFWELYGEPIIRFKSTLKIFAGALERLAGSENSGSFGPVQYLNFLASGVSPTLESTTEGWKYRWESPALISTYAVMAVMHFATGRRPVRCEHCSRLFISRSPEAKYCSDRCRNTEEMRRYRHRKADQGSG